MPAIRRAVAKKRGQSQFPGKSNDSPAFNEPNGQVLVGGIADRPGFTGHVADAQTGMDYMQQRYYDPMIGRFLSVDPVTATSVGGNFNRYWYGNDNPYKFTDLDGRLGCAASHIKSVCDSGGSGLGLSTSTRSKQDVGVNQQSSRTTQSSTRSQPQARGDQTTSTQRPLAGDIVQLTKNIAGGIKDRTTFTSEGAGAFGPGADFQANKALGPKADSLSGQFVVGEGLYGGANASFRVFSFGQQDGVGSSGKLTIDPGSYLHVKLGAGFSLGASLDFNGAGGGSFSLSVGGGLGEEVIFKPPATLGYEKEL